MPDTLAPGVYHECDACEGDGKVVFNVGIESTEPIYIGTCPDCEGAGVVPHEC